MRLTGLMGLAIGLALSAQAFANLLATPVVTDLNHPWSIALIDENQALISERNGTLLRVDLKTGQKFPIVGIPDYLSAGQGGLFEIELARDFEQSGRVFLALNNGSRLGMGLELWEGVIKDDRWTQSRQWFEMDKSFGGRHFGGRIAIGDGYLFLGTGDRGDKDSAQDPQASAGSILRFDLASGEPAGTMQGHPALYSMGHRNVQGLVWRNGELWAHEHGPQGGDEINLIRGGENHGWPLVTYGRNYGLGTRISDFETRPGYVDPQFQWTPSIAPSGMAWYDGELFESWNGGWLVGSLKFRSLVSIKQNDDQQWIESRHLTDELGRIRDVATDSMGQVWLVTDAPDGKLFRLSVR